MTVIELKSKRERITSPDESYSNKKEVIKHARKILYEQSSAIANLAFKINGEYSQALDILLNTEGHVVVSGIGKSGLIGRNMVATFASTGTPSLFVHPADAQHGDLGMIRQGDTAILISYSGETEEVIQLIPYLRKRDVSIIGFVGDLSSTLARKADVVIDISVEREVCPNNLAPTSSTVTTLAMANNLAVSLMRARDFKPHEFAEFHPGGSLGRRLLTKVKDTMRTSPLPTVGPHQTVQESLLTISEGRLGLVLIMEDGELKGIVTDGDLRRALQKHDDLRRVKISDIMTHEPIAISEEAMLYEAEEIMKTRKVTSLVVLDNQDRVSGILALLDH
jgi:arabinose-5-phosphate isomerase